MIAFQALGGGRIRAHIESAEAELLTNFVGQVAALIEERAIEVGAGSAVQPDDADDEVALLASLERSLAHIPEPEDDVLARLLPGSRRDADDETAGADADEFRRLTEADLRGTKLSDAQSVLRLLATEATDVDLDGGQAEQLLRALNDVRLSLGARLEVTEATPFPRRARNERDQALRIYFWTGGVQEELLAAISASG